jgi:hypothetical protein
MTLSVKTGGISCDFDGPHASIESLKLQSGVYMITTKLPEGTHKVIDVGESGKVRKRVENHDRSDEWERHKLDGIYFSAYYCDESTRMSMEKLVRDSYEPPCGDR